VPWLYCGVGESVDEVSRSVPAAAAVPRNCDDDDKRYQHDDNRRRHDASPRLHGNQIGRCQYLIAQNELE
jgi:hypothetical protein